MLIQNLSFTFKRANFFFDNLSVAFVANDLQFIQGENGAGKSTFFSILQGTIDPEAMLSGSIVLDNTSHCLRNNKVPLDLTKHIQLVQQDYDGMLACDFSFLENLQFANLPQYPSLRALPIAKTFDIVAKLGIDLYRPVRFLSGGQRQLLAILMALQKPTRVLLLDEPTATLDTKNSLMVVHHVAELAKRLGVTMLMISHDHTLIKGFPDKKRFVLREVDFGKRVLEAL